VRAESEINVAGGNPVIVVVRRQSILNRSRIKDDHERNVENTGPQARI
ncbi:MAG: hypothetical protein GY826_00485, partial [Fuerstiella sp.]|nr:hypothetical protein [Fuerstiella sp.]